MTFFSLQGFIYFEKNIKPTLMDIAEIRITQMATEAINSAITERVAENSNVDRLIEWKMDQNGKVSSFMIPTAEHLRVTAEAVTVVQDTLHRLENMPEYIPLGQAMNSAILASFGPDIPIKFVPAGAVKVDLNTSNEDVGINMLLVEIYIQIIVEMRIIIPFETNSEVLITKVPLSYLLIVGDVPTYYFDNKGNPVGGQNQGAIPPTISLPEIKSNIQNQQQSQQQNQQ